MIEDAAPSLGAKIGDRLRRLDQRSHLLQLRRPQDHDDGRRRLITTNDEAMATRLRQLRAHAASVSLEARHKATTVIIEQYPELGYNYKLTDFQAAIGLVQMTKLDTVVNERRRLAARYNELLAAERSHRAAVRAQGLPHIYQCYCVRLRGGPSQVPVMQHMTDSGVSTRRIMAIHEEPFYRQLMPGIRLPETERAARETLQLPIYVGLTDAEQEQVVNALSAALTAATGAPAQAAA